MDDGPRHSRDRISVRLFGPLTIEAGGLVLGARDLGGARPKQVLEILLTARGHRVSSDRLAELLWGDEPPQNAGGSLHTFVSVLRRRLAPLHVRARELVVTEPEAYRVQSDLVDLDLDRFDELLERSAHEPTHLARRSLEQALARVPGEVLEDEPYADWAEELRGTYNGRVLGAHLDAGDAALAELDYAGALAQCEAAAALDRFSERAARLQMLSLYALGRQHEALSTYRGFRARLADELGLEPTAATRAVEAAILRQEDVASLLPRPIRRRRADADVPGVRLLGRADELDALEAATQRALEGSLALLVVEGEAGLGKTRVLDELAATFADVRVGRAVCSELEQHLPYVPLAAALREALADVDLGLNARPALRAILPELWIGDTPVPTAEVDALEALVAVIADHAPLVLVLDDLHCADAATLAAIRYLQRRGNGVPAAIVAAVRTGEAGPDHPVRWLTPTAVVRLDPLTADELAPLGMPGLHESTGGNPFFVSDVIANGSNAELSATLAAAVIAQCRAEGPRAFRVLIAASVLDEPFEPKPLAALLRWDAAELSEELERLCERRALRVDGLGFRFRWDLVRQVLIANLSPARHRLLQELLDDRPLERSST